MGQHSEEQEFRWGDGVVSPGTAKVVLKRRAAVESITLFCLGSRDSNKESLFSHNLLFKTCDDGFLFSVEIQSAFIIYI